MIAQVNILYKEFENYTFNITNTAPMGQWVNSPDPEGDGGNFTGTFYTNFTSTYIFQYFMSKWF